MSGPTPETPTKAERKKETEKSDKPADDVEPNKHLKTLFLYENWAVLATGIVLLGLAIGIEETMLNPGTRLRVYLLWGLVLLGLLAVARPILGILAKAHLPQNIERRSSDCDTELYLKDWEMTKDRIKHFDDMVIRIRTQGVPVATAIIAAAFIASSTLESVKVNLSLIKVSYLSLVIGSSALLVTAIGLLDLLHYNLLLLAVRHAWNLEELPEFVGRLRITHQLTSPLLTFAHSAAAAVIYVSIASAAIYLAFLFK